MQNDILAQFRRGDTGATVSADEPQQYCAFGLRDSRRLRVRGAQGLTHALGYNILLDVVYHDREGTSFVLVYTIANVLVQGRNLQNMINALEEERAHYIQVFDADRWEMPADKNAAYVESIKFHIKDGGPKDNAATH